MGPREYVETLRKKLAAASLPADAPRVQELFDCLLKAPLEEAEQAAELVGSVVSTLMNPSRRQAMWTRMGTLTADEWRTLSGRRTIKVVTRRKVARPRPTTARVTQIPVQQLQTITAALLGVVSHAIQGAGHLSLELEKGLEEGRLSKRSPAWSVLERLLHALKTAEREDPAAVGALADLTGRVLGLVEDHPDREAELTKAFAEVAPEQLVILAQRRRESRMREDRRLERTVEELKLEIQTSADVGAARERVIKQKRFASRFGEREQKVVGPAEVYLRQGEQLLGRLKEQGGGLEGPARAQWEERYKAHKLRFGRACDAASDLLAQLLIAGPSTKTEMWWRRVVRLALERIELDALGAKRVTRSRQQRLAAQALKQVEQPKGERDILAEIAAELGRSLGKLERELQQRPNDAELKARIADTRALRERYLARQKAGARAKLASMAERAREAAADGDMDEESGEWLFEMEE